MAFQEALAAGLDQEQPGIIQVPALSAPKKYPTADHSRSQQLLRPAQLPLGNKVGVLIDKEINKVVLHPVVFKWSHQAWHYQHTSTGAKDRKIRQSAAKHVLTAIYRLGLDHEPGCAPPNCTQDMDLTSAVMSAMSMPNSFIPKGINMYKLT